MWLGIVSIIVQAFIPLWSANAAAGETSAAVGDPRAAVLADASKSSEICYVQGDPETNNRKAPAPHHTNSQGHCLLCKLPSFGNIIPDDGVRVPVAYHFEAVRYFSADQQTQFSVDYGWRPPTRAPPV